ncbi:hypothetical protein [Variovorax ginsengisoli]|uniref:DUF469 family protein n=1 Tax=Variovorax ginsengisoli TaxID=363844 RepID=A0ABT8SFD4_9BURK|nr:hypothetical protein [Variovorax ginsengisoli]MDN8618330.1 hypothetical protein [Variovorax ginsengisoli]MDO1537500.1 hypothetical protein [Variovorax ginsengisoli]
MTSHIKFGIPKAEWIEKSIDEARTDPVGLWQIVKNGRHGFGLAGSELESFVTDHIVGLMRSGAQPISGDKDSASGWRLAINAGDDPQKFAESVVEEWKHAQVDPDVDSVWFAFPTAWMS